MGAALLLHATLVVCEGVRAMDRANVHGPVHGPAQYAQYLGSTCAGSSLRFLIAVQQYIIGRKGLPLLLVLRMMFKNIMFVMFVNDE
jgi:hypothetical protein